MNMISMEKSFRHLQRSIFWALLWMNKMNLIEMYSRLGIPYLDMTDEEFEEEIQTVKRLEDWN